MASTKEFINYVCEQLKDVGEITYKKMFGDYMVYVNAKPILTICDNTVYVKKLDCIKDDMQYAKLGFPYKGAKEHYILDIDNIALSIDIIKKVEKVTAIPKKRKSK